MRDPDTVQVIEGCPPFLSNFKEIAIKWSRNSAGPFFTAQSCLRMRESVFRSEMIQGDNIMSIPAPEHQNSAGRLLSILIAIPEGKQLLETLPPLFGFEATNMQQKQQAALVALMELHKIYIEFRQDMIDANISEKQRNVMLGGLETLVQTIYPVNLQGGTRKITAAEVSLLRVCATFISEDEAVTKDDIAKIRDSIDELRDEVEDSDISPSLRKILLEIIRLSEDAISRYNIHGARGLRKAFKMMLADAAELYGMTDQNADRQSLIKTPAWTAIINHLKIYDDIASRLLKYKPLLTYVSQILIGSSTPPSQPLQ